MSGGVTKCHTPESPLQALELRLPVLFQMGVPLKHGKLSTQAHPSFYHWTGRYHTSPVDDSLLSGSDVVLDWAITHQSDPFPCPYSTRPQWVRRRREALAKDPLSTSPRAAVDIEDAVTVDGEVATERTVPVPKLGFPPELAPGPSSR